MSGDLRVHTGGLRSGAASSNTIADALTTEAVSIAVGLPCHDGLTAMGAAIASVRDRQATRVSGQADAMSTGSIRCDTTDNGSADTISVTV